MNGDHEVYCRREIISQPQQSDAGVLVDNDNDDADDPPSDENEMSRNPEGGDESVDCDPGTTGVPCFLCQRIYTTKSILNRHLKLKHDISVTSGYRSLHCPVSKCFRNFNFMSYLRHHIATEHGYQMDEACVVNLRSESEFHEWKLAEERSSLSKYVKKHGRRRNHSRGNTQVEVEEYICNRSGFYESGSRGLRKAKAQGSVKMNAMCPSTITAYFRPLSGDVEVKYFPTHVGHDRDLEHLCLARHEKVQVERLIADGASVDSVLDAVRAHDRCHAETLETVATRYIRNAESVYDMMVDHQSFTVQDCEESGLDSHVRTRVAMLVSELIELGADHNPLLEDAKVSDDELLVFTMSAFQAQLLRQFGQDGVVCVDQVTSTSCVNLSVTCVSVILADQSAFPCAFCVHVGASQSRTHLPRFLQAIRGRTGRVQPRVLLSSECPLHVDCWRSAMGSTPERHVMAPWAVDRDWRRSLFRASKQPLKQAVVYKSLHRLLHENDRTQFDQLCSSFVRHIADRSYGKMFLKYFRHTYLNREDQWANSFQAAEHADQCVQLEALHRALSATLADKRATNVDAVFHVIFRLVREQSLMQTSLLSDDDVAARSTNAIVCHEASAELDGVSEIVEVGLIGSRQWLVRSTDKSPGDYIVDRARESCPVPYSRSGSDSCGVRCAQCDVCAHIFLCTCVDSVVRGDICRHVHLVAKMLQRSRNIEIIVVADADGDHRERHVFVDDEVGLPSPPPLSSSTDRLEDLRMDVDKYCSTIAECLQCLRSNVDNVERLEHIRDTLRTVCLSLEDVVQ